MTFFERALLMSMKAHAGQVDRHGHPVILISLRLAGRFLDNHTAAGIALLKNVVAFTHDTYGQIGLPDIHHAFGDFVSTQLDALTRRRQGMLYRAATMNGRLKWAIATDTEPYLQQHIPRVKRHDLAREVLVAEILDSSGILDFNHLDRGKRRGHGPGLLLSCSI